MKMILADDEPVITRGIQKLVDWNSLGIEIVGAFEDGKKALEGIIRLKPELALLDISMPGMTGIEILKECNAMEVKTKIIFISGFQDFEYAKDAIKYGAVDYLLKPVIEEELLHAVGKCLDSKPQDAKNDELLEKDSEQKKADYSKLIMVENTSYIPVYAKILYESNVNEQMKKLIRFSLISFLEEYLDEKQIGITFIKNDNIVIVLKGISPSECQNVVEEMQEKAVRATNHQIGFIVGTKVSNMGEIPDAFDTCMNMEGYFFFAKFLNRWVFHVGMTVFSNHSDSERLNDLREKILNSIVAQDMEGFKQAFEQFAKMICRVADGRKEDAGFYFCNAVRLMEEKMTSLNLSGLQLEMKNFLEKGRQSGDYSEMVDVYQNYLVEYLNIIQKTVANNDRKDIQKAMNYIEKHYKENLTLNILAEEIHMNSYYFSSFFKKSAGENFKDYVNRVRIQHAVALIVSTNMKTYEIANEVGFSDARAFTEIFQRIYHETPSAYRKRVSGNKN